MSNDTCPSCGIPWKLHLGPTGVCEQLQRARQEITELRKFRVSAQIRSAELIEDRLRLERMVGLAKGDPMRLVLQELDKAMAEYPSWDFDLFRGMNLLFEEAGEAAKALNELEWHNGPIEDLITELAQAGAMSLRMIGHVLKYQVQGGNDHGTREILPPA